jgi:hypothetical protein
MTCDEYYKTESYEGVGHDRCAIPRIEADTAANVAILTSTTTFFSKLPLIANAIYAEISGDL